jgi:hypothetical protein
MSRIHHVALGALLALSSTARAQSAEICGNGIDDNSNGMTDEGCWNLTSGQCVSPLSCEVTGSVSPKKGTLRYSLPPDVAPKVPYGPGIGFRRTYLSQYQPGSGAAAWKTPLGDRWHHTYMTWLTKTSPPGAAPWLVWHTSQGQDIRAAYASQDATWDYYTPQTGIHVDKIKQRRSWPYEFQLRMLTGETLVYNLSGQLTEIWDTLASPNTNKVLITYNNNAQVSTVTDASNTRRLLFSYNTTETRLTGVAFQLFISSTWTTQHTTSFDYTNDVTVDSSSGRPVPATSIEWSNLLEGTGLPTPSSLWLMQETSGNVADSIGTRTGTASSGMTYQVSASGWTRKGIQVTTDGSPDTITIPTPAVDEYSMLFAQVFSLNTMPWSDSRGLNRIGVSARVSSIASLADVWLKADSGSYSMTGTQTYSSSETVLVLSKLDHSRSEFVIYTDKGDVIKTPLQTPNADTSSYLLGNGIISSDATLGPANERVDRIAIEMDRGGSTATGRA